MQKTMKTELRQWTAFSNPVPHHKDMHWLHHKIYMMDTKCAVRWRVELLHIFMASNKVTLMLFIFLAIFSSFFFIYISHEDNPMLIGMSLQSHCGWWGGWTHRSSSWLHFICFALHALPLSVLIDVYIYIYIYMYVYIYIYTRLSVNAIARIPNPRRENSQG